MGRWLGKAIIRTLLLASLATLLPYGWAMWGVKLSSVPVERLVKNAEEYIKENQKDPHGYYVLGRLHSMAFAENEQSLDVIDNGEKTPELEPTPPKDGKKLPDFYPGDSVMIRRSWKGTELSKELQEHLSASIENYQKATELDPKDAKSFLGLAWVIQEGSNWAELFDKIPWGKDPTKELSSDENGKFKNLIEQLGSDTFKEIELAEKELNDALPRIIELLLKERQNKSQIVRRGVKELLKFYWLDKSVSAYRKAYDLTIKGDLEREFSGPRGDDVISFEAGNAILEILEKREYVKESEKIEAQKNMEKLHIKGFAVTPIIFSLDSPKTLAELVEPTKGVYFDLDGAGAQMWQWVKPDTAILVWDQEGTGKITSGLQLFGSVTWWIFWDNGYQALDLLDDNRDEWLSGDKLKGLAVWFDKNGNGVCDPGEVVPVEKLGIEKIAVKAAGKSEGVACNQQGIYLRNGAVLPTYDWISRRILPTSVAAQK